MLRRMDSPVKVLINAAKPTYAESTKTRSIICKQSISHPVNRFHGHRPRHEKASYLEVCLSSRNNEPPFPSQQDSKQIIGTSTDPNLVSKVAQEANFTIQLLQLALAGAHFASNSVLKHPHSRRSENSECTYDENESASSTVANIHNSLKVLQSCFQGCPFDPKSEPALVNGGQNMEIGVSTVVSCSNNEHKPSDSLSIAPAANAAMQQIDISMSTSSSVDCVASADTCLDAVIWDAPKQIEEQPQDIDMWACLGGVCEPEEANTFCSEWNQW
mmetsp:Transcript_44211/g.117919  ORF Transcript_44211/g.117919 Transcript_44211/m.117919 type:complete len:273 (+) Transcript_44211:109-927(+)